MTKPSNPKERNLVKGAIMRVFSRSELRRAVLDTADIQHLDPTRPRVKKWSLCRSCLTPTPKYLMQVDHVEPKVPLNKSLEEMTWDEVVDNTWCDITNLNPICIACHKIKSKLETQIRKRNKDAKRKAAKIPSKNCSKRTSTRSAHSRAIQRARKTNK